MDVTIRQCVPDDLGLLRDISRKTYFETFAAMNTPENMAAYLDEAFAAERLCEQIGDADSSFYFLYCGDEPAGYVKVNEGPAQTDMGDSAALEIERIYVLKPFQGAGLGQYLLDWALRIAAGRGKRYCWLGVWEKNKRALHFYKKNGFYPIGVHSFWMGKDEQTDYIMRKDLL